MESGRFYIETRDSDILKILAHICPEPVMSVFQICERYGDEAEDVRHYDVYQIHISSGSWILKKTDEKESFQYEQFLSGYNFSVPAYYGKWVNQEDVWILIEDIPGTDLRDMTDTLAIQAADSLSAFQNHYWQDSEEAFSAHKFDNRFEVYWKRILRRAASVAEDPVLRKAYQLFLDRQLTCPRTLSNGDFLQFNVVQHNGKVYVIDWGFGGIMPYSLDIARFIAHATENRATFPFYMTDHQKRLFIDRVYNNLDVKPSYPEYLRDIQLALLNEYIEFVEAGEDEDHWYLDHANLLARKILSQDS